MATVTDLTTLAELPDEIEDELDTTWEDYTAPPTATRIYAYFSGQAGDVAGGQDPSAWVATDTIPADTWFAVWERPEHGRTQHAFQLRAAAVATPVRLRIV